MEDPSKIDCGYNLFLSTTVFFLSAQIMRRDEMQLFYQNLDASSCLAESAQILWLERAVPFAQPRFEGPFWNPTKMLNSIAHTINPALALREWMSPHASLEVAAGNQLL